MGAALELGGDEVAKIFFTNGEDQSIYAGQGISLALGAEYRFAQLDKLSIRGTFGIKYVTTAADNAHIRLTRIPLIFTANWMATDKIRLASGLVSHQNIRLKTDGIGTDENFSSKPGIIFEIAYKNVGLTYTVLTYSDGTNQSYSANCVGLTVSGIIRKRN